MFIQEHAVLGKIPFTNQVLFFFFFFFLFTETSKWGNSINTKLIKHRFPVGFIRDVFKPVTPWPTLASAA